MTNHIIKKIEQLSQSQNESLRDYIFRVAKHIEDANYSFRHRLALIRKSCKAIDQSKLPRKDPYNIEALLDRVQQSEVTDSGSWVSVVDTGITAQLSTYMKRFIDEDIAETVVDLKRQVESNQSNQINMARLHQ